MNEEDELADASAFSSFIISPSSLILPLKAKETWSVPFESRGLVF
jgi:hypothetical protein